MNREDVSARSHVKGITQAVTTQRPHLKDYILIRNVFFNLLATAALSDHVNVLLTFDSATYLLISPRRSPLMRMNT